VTSRPKVGTVLVCPFGQISTLPTGHPLATTREQEKARRGHLPGFHILNECDIAGFEFGFSFVALREVYGVNFSFLRAVVERQERRLRLLPPYREHLSQAFARFFMRVGLPLDIPSFAGNA